MFNQVLNDVNWLSVLFIPLFILLYILAVYMCLRLSWIDYYVAKMLKEAVIGRAKLRKAFLTDHKRGLASTQQTFDGINSIKYIVHYELPFWKYSYGKTR